MLLVGGWQAQQWEWCQLHQRTNVFIRASRYVALEKYMYSVPAVFLGVHFIFCFFSGGSIVHRGLRRHFAGKNDN